jgi:hypothetical protein
MSSFLARFDESQIKNLLLRVLSWRLGDTPDLPTKLSQSISSDHSQTLQLLELLCPALDIAVNQNPCSAEEILENLKNTLDEDANRKIAKAAFESKENCITFCKDHAPSLSRALYHDWKLETQIATESLGRIARPVASITLRIQPSSKDALLLPPLESVSMELAKDMVDALSSGFDRLQTQLSRIVK